MRRTLVGLVAVASALALTGCGRSSESYCEELEAKSAVFTSAAGATDVAALSDVLDTIGELRKESPEELRDEWDTFYYAWEGLVEALDEAGLTGEIPPGGKRPDGVSEADWQQVEAAAEELASPRVGDAVSSLEQQALDVCKVNLGG